MTRRVAAVLTLTAALLAGGCADDDAARSGAATNSTTPSTSPTSAAPTTPSETAFEGTEIEVAVKDGKVSPSTRRVEVSQGTAVRLLVTSDVADELHVHGYDFRQDLPAGQQATLDFTADETGLFEVETEQSHLQLVQLEVR